MQARAPGRGWLPLEGMERVTGRKWAHSGGAVLVLVVVWRGARATQAALMQGDPGDKMARAGGRKPEGAWEGAVARGAACRHEANEDGAGDGVAESKRGCGVGDRVAGLMVDGGADEAAHSPAQEGAGCTVVWVAGAMVGGGASAASSSGGEKRGMATRTWEV